MLPNKTLIAKPCYSLVQFLKWVCFSCVDKLNPFIPRPFMFALAEDWRQVWWCFCIKQVISLDMRLLDLAARHSFMWAKGLFFCEPQSNISLLNLYRWRGTRNNVGLPWDAQTGTALDGLSCSLLHSSVWKRKKHFLWLTCDWSQLDRAYTCFQILTSHRVNIFRRYLYVTRSSMSI